MNPEHSSDPEHAILKAYHWGNKRERDFVIWKKVTKNQEEYRQWFATAEMIQRVSSFAALLTGGGTRTENTARFWVCGPLDQ